MPRTALKRNPPGALPGRRKKPEPGLVTLVRQYRATLPRLAEIAAIRPAPHAPTVVLDGEEKALLLAHERLIAEAAARRADTLAEIRCKLDLWRLEVVGAGRKPESVTDALVVSAIGDLKRLIKRMANDA